MTDEEFKKFCKRYESGAKWKLFDKYYTVKTDHYAFGSAYIEFEGMKNYVDTAELVDPNSDWEYIGE